MRKIILVSTIIILIQYPVQAQRYAFDSIPSFLKNRADAVVRTEQMVYSIYEEGKANMKVKVAITLLNENASDYRFVSVYYDKFNKIASIKASQYDEKGKLIKIIRQADILDMSAVSGGTFYSDDRKKLIIFPFMKYPYTIEYEYSINTSSILNYPTWEFQDNPKVSVEKSGVQYIIPKKMGIKFKEMNLRYKSDSISIKDKIIYTWQELNIPTVKTNSYGIPFLKRSPRLLAAPYTFEFDGYKGSMESWRSFGEWNRKIINGRDILPQSEVNKVNELVKNIVEEKQKIKAIYEYMQSKTRYVSIQLGIGGLQPFEASFVSDKGYGDCKALTNYTMALLKATGIQSHYTLVKSGDFNDVDPAFISDQFDHIILCVPTSKDTVWLECTSQTLPFNYLSSFTSNRYVLLTTSDGGKLVRTPNFDINDNSVKRKGEVKINQLGSISKANFSANFSGMYFDISQDRYALQSDEEVKRSLNASINFPTFEVTKVGFEEFKSEKPTSTLNYELNIRDLCIKSENKLFFTPCIIKENYILNEPFNIQINSSSTNIDSITYDLPLDYSIDYIPENKKIDSPFGTYLYSINVNGNKIEFVRSFDIKNGKYDINRFKEFHSFINSIAQSDRNMIILKKNNN